MSLGRQRSGSEQDDERQRKGDTPKSTCLFFLFLDIELGCVRQMNASGQLVWIISRDMGNYVDGDGHLHHIPLTSHLITTAYLSLRTAWTIDGASTYLDLLS